MSKIGTSEIEVSGGEISDIEPSTIPESTTGTSEIEISDAEVSDRGFSIASVSGAEASTATGENVNSIGEAGTSEVEISFLSLSKRASNPHFFISGFSSLALASEDTISAHSSKGFGKVGGINGVMTSFE